MAGPVTVKNYDGTSTLYTYNDNDLYDISVTTTGLELYDGVPWQPWTYSGSDTFSGFALTPNATSATYPAPSSGSTTMTGLTYPLTLYAIGSNDLPTLVDYRPLSYTDAKVQVESAIRDGEGVKISTNYAKKTEIQNGVLTINTQGGTTLGTFSANQSTNTPVTITLPNGTVQLLNQSVTFDTYTPTQAEIDAGTYDEFPYKASVSVTGVTSSTYAEVTYSEEQATSLNFATFCDTGTGVIYLYSRTNVGTVTIPTISIGMDYSDIVIDSAPTSGSGNAISSGAVYTALTDGSVTKIGTTSVGTDLKPIKLVNGVPTAVAYNFVDINTNQEIGGYKVFTLPPGVKYSLPQIYFDGTVDDYTTSYTATETKYYIACRDKNKKATFYISQYVYNGGRGTSISNLDKSSGSEKVATVGLQTPKSGNPYVTATYRAYSSSNVNDVMTIGMFEASNRNKTVMVGHTLTTNSAVPVFITNWTADKAGVYLFVGRVQGEPKSGGYYLLGFSTGTNPGASEWFLNVPLLNGDYQRGTISYVVRLNQGDNMKLAYYQTSGTDQACSGWLTAVYLEP